MGGTYPWWSYTACPVLSLFHVPSHSFQEDLILDISQHRDVADGSVFSLVFDYNLLRNGSDIVVFFFFFPATRDFTWQPWLFKYYQEWLGNYTSHIPQNSGMHLFRTHRLMGVHFLMWSQNWSSLTVGGALIVQSSNSCTQGVCHLPLMSLWPESVLKLCQIILKIL